MIRQIWKRNQVVKGKNVPEDWAVKKLGDFCELTAGGTPSTARPEYWGGDVKWMSSGELNLKKVYDVEGRITPLGLSSSSTKMIPQDSILIGLAGQGKTRGTVAMNKVELCTNQSVAAIIPKSNVNPEYIYYNLDSRYLEIRNLSTGDGGRGGLNLGILKKIKLAIPPLPEQRKIAEILSTWDEAIAQTKALIEQLKLRNKGLAQQLLTGKKRLKGFSGEWKTYKFEELLRTVKRPVDWDDEALYKLISVRRRSGGIFYREALYGKQIKVKNLKTAKTGDFLFSKMQIVHGASALVTSDFDDAKISGSYISVRSKNSDPLNIEFLNWYSKLPVFYHQTYTSSYGVHIEKMTFDFKLFLRESINLPPLVEQTRIVTILKEADSELRIQEDKLGSLVQQKKGLMQKLLTGDVRVKIDENAE